MLNMIRKENLFWVLTLLSLINLILDVINLFHFIYLVSFVIRQNLYTIG